MTRSRSVPVGQLYGRITGEPKGFRQKIAQEFDPSAGRVRKFRFAAAQRQKESPPARAGLPHFKQTYFKRTG